MGPLLVSAWLLGCSTPQPPPQDAPPGQRGGKVAKGKGKMKGGKPPKGGKMAKKGKMPTPAPPIGVAGPATGELQLVVADTPAPPAPPAPPPPAEGEPAPAPAPAPAPGKETAATLALTFADGSTQTVELGSVPGTCTEVEPKPIGPAEQQHTPLWAVQCVDAVEGSSDVAVLQLGTTISVVRAATPAEGATPQFKPVKRVRLVPGVTVAKKPQG